MTKNDGVRVGSVVTSKTPARGEASAHASPILPRLAGCGSDVDGGLWFVGAAPAVGVPSETGAAGRCGRAGVIASMPESRPATATSPRRTDATVRELTEEAYAS